MPDWPGRGSPAAFDSEEHRLVAARLLIATGFTDNGLQVLEQTDPGEPISVRRLEARPTATLSLEAQERHERLERTHRDD